MVPVTMKTMKRMRTTMSPMVKKKREKVLPNLA
jgi:hypothetical protein